MVLHLQGDILFGIAFIQALDEEQTTDDLQVEVIIDVNRVSSSNEPIEGSFSLPCEGVVVFLWDNSFDWASNKKLTYHIEVKEVIRDEGIKYVLKLCFHFPL